MLKTVDSSVFEGTPFWQHRESAGRHTKALLAFLGGGALNTAVRFCKREDHRQDLLLLDPHEGFAKRIAITCNEILRSSAPGMGIEMPYTYAIQLGKAQCAADDPQRGRQLLQEEENAVRALLSRYRYVIVTANLAGGTGGSAPLLAQWLREMGIPHTILACTPFAFEGKRMELAQSALGQLQGSPLVEVSYEGMRQRAENEGGKVTLCDAFELADEEVCRQLELVLARSGLQ